MKTLLHILADCSGSMSGKESDVIGGINGFIDDQRAAPGEATLSIVRFDHEYEIVRPTQSVQLIAPLTPSEYVVRGSTALLDAIGRSLIDIEAAWRTERPDRAIMVICTDGEENASKQYKLEHIKQMIRAREESGRWAFIYLGVGVDAFSQGAGLGVSMHNTASYTGSGIGTRSAYMATSASVATMRATGSNNANLGGAVPEHGTFTVPVPGTQATTQTIVTPTWAPPEAKPDSSTWAPPA